VALEHPGESEREAADSRRGTFAGVARELTNAGELAEAREALCETVDLWDYAECRLHLRGLPTRSKIQDLRRYWFDTGIPLVIELAEREDRR
jgi:hypothetical protein